MASKDFQKALGPDTGAKGGGGSFEAAIAISFRTQLTWPWSGRGEAERELKDGAYFSKALGMSSSVNRIFPPDAF